METRRTTATLALYQRGSRSKGRTLSSLRYLNDWAGREVASSLTNAYREQWQAEVDASTEALAAIEGGVL